MNRPQPKELVIRLSGDTDLIVITATSTDAHGWIDREAPQFGTFSGFAGDRALLSVSDAYDPAEVAAWLATYNQAGAQP